MIETTSSSVTYPGNGVAGRSFSFDFPLVATSHLVVFTTVTATNTDTPVTTGFTVTPLTDVNGRITGGSVVVNNAIPTTSKITFKRVTPKTQTLNFESGGSFQAESLESSLDKITMILQEIARDAL